MSVGCDACGQRVEPPLCVLELWLAAGACVPDAAWLLCGACAAGVTRQLPPVRLAAGVRSPGRAARSKGPGRARRRGS